MKRVAALCLPLALTLACTRAFAALSVDAIFGPPAAAKRDVHPTKNRPVGERLALLEMRDANLAHGGDLPAPSFTLSVN